MIYTGCDRRNRGSSDPGKRGIQTIQTLLTHSAQASSPSAPGREKPREGLYMNEISCEGRSQGNHTRLKSVISLPNSIIQKPSKEWISATTLSSGLLMRSSGTGGWLLQVCSWWIPPMITDRHTNKAWRSSSGGLRYHDISTVWCLMKGMCHLVNELQIFKHY